MRQVGVYEAKTQLPRLLARVRKGERITITRHGVPIAELVPPSGTPHESIDDIVAALKRFGQGRSLGRTSLKALIGHGRR